MRIRILLAGWLMAAVCAVPVLAQEPAKEAADGKKPAEAEKTAPKAAPEPEKAANAEPEPPQSKSSRVELDRFAKGPPVLVVHYPWAAHHRASIEIRPLAPGETTGAAVRPVKFVERFFKGKVTETIYAVRDRAWDEPSSEELTERGRALEILGRRNRLGKPCATVVLPGLDAPDDKKPQEEVGPRAVFPLLESWSFDSRTLRLELPSPQFKKPGLLHVWFLREGDVLWEETVRWPGLK